MTYTIYLDKSVGGKEFTAFTIVLANLMAADGKKFEAGETYEVEITKHEKKPQYFQLVCPKCSKVGHYPKVLSANCIAGCGAKVSVAEGEVKWTY